MNVWSSLMYTFWRIGWEFFLSMYGVFISFCEKVTTLYINLDRQNMWGSAKHGRRVKFHNIFIKYFS